MAGVSAANALPHTTSVGTGTTALPNERFNYIRNSVKATVDAYDGTVTLYEMDTQDPVLKAWMGVFPGTVKATIPVRP